MFFGTYRFEGDPAQLKQAYDRMLDLLPQENLSLHACVPDDTGMWIFDTCPTQEIFMEFSASEDLRNALKTAGLPEPEVLPVGEVHAAFVDGKRTV
jgi:hypothetical protein